MKLSKFATMRGMTFAYDSTNQFLIDSMLNSSDGDAMRQELKLKRIQFDAPPQLSDALETVCSLLSCSKREFLTMAVWEACESAQLLFEEAFKDVSGQEISDAFPAQESE